MSQEEVKIVVNPVAASGKVAKRWPRIARRLKERSIRFSHAITEAVGHATEITRQAIADGYRTIIANGGDGTLNEVLNGLVDGGVIDPSVRLGVIPGGTGSDFVRTLGVPRDGERSLDCIEANHTRLVDVGEILFDSPESQHVRYFLNVAGLGFDGEVSEYCNRNSKAAGGTVTYLKGLLVNLAAYRNKRVEVTLDDRSFTQRVNSVVVCNGQYAGGGMHLGPGAQVDDGIFDVVIIGDVGKLEFIANLPRVYKGTHLTHPKVSWFRSKTIRVTSQEPMYMQAEGELVGMAPAALRVIPQALRFLV
jgi:diacylglycerol kinase (ATP)